MSTRNNHIESSLEGFELGKRSRRYSVDQERKEQYDASERLNGKYGRITDDVVEQTPPKSPPPPTAAAAAVSTITSRSEITPTVTGHAHVMSSSSSQASSPSSSMLSSQHASLNEDNHNNGKYAASNVDFSAARPKKDEEEDVDDERKMNQEDQGNESCDDNEEESEEESTYDIQGTTEEMTTTTKTTEANVRKSSRGVSSISRLAKDIVIGRKRVVFITGAGISVASGVRPFRGKNAVWEQHIWTTATRAAFRKDPLKWYNTFFLKSLVLPDKVYPNDGHLAIDQLLTLFPDTLKLITQNIDGLHNTFSSTLRPIQHIEAHGRLGLFKCLPLNADDDSDTDDDSDEDDDRPVHLGHRRKYRKVAERSRKILKSTGSRSVHCPYQQHDSVRVDQVEPYSTRVALQDGEQSLSVAPKCPRCGNFLAPQALLFDEGYHSHDFYQFEKMEDWLAEAEVIVFVGTSFKVRISEAILDHARAEGLHVFNFNTSDILTASSTLHAANIRGKSEVTLVDLLQQVEDLIEEQKADAAAADGVQLPMDEFSFVPT